MSKYISKWSHSVLAQFYPASKPGLQFVTFSGHTLRSFRLITYIEVTSKVSFQLGINDVAGLLTIKEQAGIFGIVFPTSSTLSLLSCFASLPSWPSPASRCACFHHHPMAGLEGDASSRFNGYLLLSDAWGEAAEGPSKKEMNDKWKQSEPLNDQSQVKFKFLFLLPGVAFSLSLLSSDPELMVWTSSLSERVITSCFFPVSGFTWLQENNLFSNLILGDDINY